MENNLHPENHFIVVKEHKNNLDMASQDVEKLIDSARQLFDNEEYLAARALYTQALTLDPFDARIWNHRSNTHLKLGYPELAFTDAARGLQILDDKLAKKTLSREDRNDCVFLKLDVLYTCLLATEALNTFQMALQYINRLLANSHLLSNEVHKTVLKKQAIFHDKINQKVNTLNKTNIPSGVSIDTISNLGTMRIVTYPWDDFEPFNSANDIETEMKKLNNALESFAPKLMIVQMPDNPALYNSELVSSASISKTGRPQLGIIARKTIKSKERILDETGIFVNNGLYGPKCNYCNSILSTSTNKSNEIHKTTCRECGERFCSVDCLQSAMETYHKTLCGRDISHIVEFVARGISCSSLIHLFVLRLLAIAVQNKQHPLEINAVKYLAKGVKEVVPWDIYQSYFMYLDLLKILGLCPYRDIDKFDFWIYYTLRNKLLPNVFGEYKAPMKPANGKLFPFSSFFNHSCVSNVIYITSRNAHQVIVARKEGIEKNQQVFISYIDPDRPFIERQQLFQITYGFVCRCERCVREIGTSNEEEILKKTAQ
ncbi:hypothetical protein I4U23_011081 [Adineta vaga]|nr:hypothetical protein I4U23_011081 [Adineta vaga]